MINALNIATQGLLQAERRATDIAKDILKTTSEAAPFTLNEDTSPTGLPSDTANNEQNTTPPNTVATASGPSPAAPTSPSTHPGFGNLIQQFADLRAEQTAFEANAKVFKTVDETLGTLLDDLG